MTVYLQIPLLWPGCHTSAMGIDHLIFVTPPSPQLHCPICSEVFLTPVCCPKGHAFCKPCISQWLETHTLCPTCRCFMALEGRCATAWWAT